MSNYKKGAKAEYEAIDVLELLGYYCIRSAGSHGLWDIVACSATHVRLIQVKTEGAMTPQELEQIELFVAPPFTSKEVWTRIPDQPILDRWKVEVYK